FREDLLANTPLEKWPTLGHDYNIVDIQAPAASGKMLQFLSYLVAKSPLSPWILRGMLDKNKVYQIRELVHGYPNIFANLPPKHFPVHKASREQIQWGKVWNNKYRKSTLKPGSSYELSRVKGGIDPAPGYRTIRDYYSVYGRKQATPSEVMKRLIDGVENHVAHLNMFAAILPDDILKQAKESDARWAAGKPLSIWDGVPVAIKDMSPIAGLPLCDGSSECTMMVKDDYPAQRFRKSGAIIVGSTVMTEGGVTPLGYAAFFDGPFNPYDVDYYSGGSSGGSSVAVASGVVPVAVGWDGGGSVRIPASMSGVEGLATTFGRIPFSKASSSTNIKAGPLATTMTDIALSYLLLSEPHPESFYSDIIGDAYLPKPSLPPNAQAVDTDRLDGIRLGVFWDHFQHTDPEILDKSLKVVRFLEQRGATIVNITIPHMREIHLSHNLKIVSEFGIAWESRFYNESYQLEPNTEITVKFGRSVTADEVLAAEKVRHFAIKYVRKNLFAGLKLDAIVSPMMGTKIPRIPKNAKGYGESNIPLSLKVMRYAPLANFLGLPGLSIPIGYEGDTGLPIGFQLLGDAWSEPSLMRIGTVVERFQVRKKPPAENYFDVLAPWMKQ
ncbi:MAG: hypothetical protein SGILL_008844, partial [Bacillariaceae sp.]